MHSNSSYLVDLVYRYCSGETLTAEEQSRLNAWLNESAANQAVLEQLQDAGQLQAAISQWHRMEQHKTSDWSRFAEKMDEGSTDTTVVVRSIHTMKRWIAAAAVLLLAVLGTWLWFSGKQQSVAPEGKTPLAVNIPPGREGAVLTLSNGSKVSLDSIQNGLIAREGGADVEMKNGKLAYTPAGAASSQLNTITTPNGRQFHVQLPDGSHVWLNAASAITYPTAFTGNERKVSITGEAYFEIASNAAQPFFVKMEKGGEVQVLGTSFNVNAYNNERLIKTTLLAGSVKIVAGEETALLKPGQQARFTGGTSDNITVVTAHADQELAWKNGLFNFDEEDIPAFLRQLERWYDISVQLHGHLPAVKFKGGLDRNASLNDILKVLSKLNIHYRLEGRVLIVGEQ